MSDIRKFVLIFVLVVGGGFFAYYFNGIVQQKPFSDDWMMLEIARELKGRPLAEWVQVKDHFSQWRPLPFILKGAYLNGEAPGLAPYNFFKLLLFLGIALLTYGTAALFFEKRNIALLACLLFLVNPTNVGAVQNIDHIFKLTGTLFYALAILSLHHALAERRLLYFCGFVLSYLAGFLSDADVVAVFPATVLVVLYHLHLISRRRALYVGASSLFLLFAYLYIRSSIVAGGVTAGGVPGQQDILFDTTVLINGMKMLASMLVFTVSPYIFLGKKVFVAAGAVFCLINVFVVIASIFFSLPEDRKKMVLLLGLACVATAPFVLLRHVSEIYTVKAACLLMVVLAFSYYTILSRWHGPGRCVVAACLVVMTLSGMHALLVKQGMMIERGKMAERMALSMQDVLPAPPPYSTVELVIDRCDAGRTYSDFINDDYLLAQLDKRYDYFIRYNYSDSTLNRIDNAKNVYSLKWDCVKKTFIKSER